MKADINPIGLEPQAETQADLHSIQAPQSRIGRRQFPRPIPASDPASEFLQGLSGWQFSVCYNSGLAFMKIYNSRCPDCGIGTHVRRRNYGY
jgi:hypothetical protein